MDLNPQPAAYKAAALPIELPYRVAGFADNRRTVWSNWYRSSTLHPVLEVLVTGAGVEPGFQRFLECLQTTPYVLPVMFGVVADQRGLEP